MRKLFLDNLLLNLIRMVKWALDSHIRKLTRI